MCTRNTGGKWKRTKKQKKKKISFVLRYSTWEMNIKCSHWFTLLIHEYPGINTSAVIFHSKMYFLIPMKKKKKWKKEHHFNLSISHTQHSFEWKWCLIWEMIEIKNLRFYSAFFPPFFPFSLASVNFSCVNLVHFSI